MPSAKVIDKISFKQGGLVETYHISNSVNGYLNSTDGKFYAESTFITELPAVETMLYIDISTDYIYRYSEADTEYIQVGGSGDASDAIIYVNSLPSSDIKDVIYGIISKTAYTGTIADGFLDDNDLFEKTARVGSDYTYTAAEGVELEASADDTTYKGFTSLAYDGTSDWTLTFIDGTSATLADSDTFYFKQVFRNFYAGNSTEQIVTPFASGGGGGGGANYFAGEGIDITNNIISTSPATTSTLGGVKPDDDTIKVDANGILSGNYEGGYGIKVTGNEVASKTFVGTQTEWDNLTSTQKAKFDTVSITDDSNTTNNTPGHEIIDESDTTFPQRTKMKIEGATITDDSTNDVTVITPTPYTAGRKIEIDNYEIAADETLKGTFIGTQNEWNALTTTEKAEYEVVNITDDLMTGSTVVDVVENNNMNAVTSNAVFNVVNTKVEKINVGNVSTSTTDLKLFLNTIIQNHMLSKNNGAYLLYGIWVGSSQFIIHAHKTSAYVLLTCVIASGSFWHYYDLTNDSAITYGTYFTQIT